MSQVLSLAPSVFRLKSAPLYNNPSLVNLGCKRLGQHLRRDPRQLIRVQQEIVLVCPAVSAVLGLGLERVRDRRPRSERRVLGNADRKRDLVRRCEADAPDVAAEAIGIGLHDGDGVGTVLPHDLRHLDDRDAVGLSEDHVLAHRLVLMPARADLLNLRLAELRHFAKPSRLVRQDHHRVLAERIDDALRQDRTDPLDEPRGEIPLDALQRPRRNAREGLCLELAAVHLVRHPLALGLDVLALPHGLRLTDDRDLRIPRELEFARNLNVQDRISALVVVKHDRADGPFDNLLIGACWRCVQRQA